MSAVAPTQQNVLLIGDLALYHDMNGLFLAKRYQLPLTIVLLNNNGGGIFSFLSQRTLREDDFEPLFGTPLDLDFSLVAELYGASYQEVKTIAELKQILQTAAEEPQFQVIEVKGNRQENVHLYESILAEIGRRVERQGFHGTVNSGDAVPLSMVNTFDAKRTTVVCLHGFTGTLATFATVFPVKHLITF